MTCKILESRRWAWHRMSFTASLQGVGPIAVAVPRALSWALLIVAVGGTMLAQAPLNAYRGSWVNEDPNTGGMTRLQIFQNLEVQAWGACTPTECDWGRVQGRYTQRGITAYWSTLPATSCQIETWNDNRLQVSCITTFENGGRRQDRYIMRRR